MIEYLDNSGSAPTTPSTFGFKQYKADIVAVHGIDEDARRTWTDPESGVLWLRDLFPHKTHNARILSFSYDSPHNSMLGADRVLTLATNLVGELCADRAIANATERPIIFVCHGFGGLIVKKALAYSESKRSSKVQHLRDLYVSTYGIIFFGTPHKGIEKNTLLLLHEYGRSTRRGPSQLELSLMRDSELVQDIEDQFAPMTKRMAIYNLWEGEPTAFGKQYKYVVERKSAAPPWPHAESNELPAMHGAMTKFANKRDPGYMLVLSALLRYLKCSLVEIPIRWTEDKEALQTERYHEAETLLGAHIPQQLAHSPQIGAQNDWYMVPRGSSKYFTGRRTHTEVVKNKLGAIGRHKDQLNHQIFVIWGLGGSGKTQFCLRYAEDHRSRYWGVFWIDASSRETAEAGYAAIGHQAGRGSTSGAGMLWLSQCSHPWLLVLDNADDPGLDVSNYLPAGAGGHILITTRNPRVIEYSTAGRIRFSGMEPEDGIRLLLNTAYADTDAQEIGDRDRKAARSIASELGYLALALANAGTAIRLKIYTFDKYLHYYLGHRKRTISSPSITTATEADIISTWEIPFQKIARNSSSIYCDAVYLLHVLAFLHFESIPESIFLRAWQAVGDRALLDKSIAQWIFQQWDDDLEPRLRASLAVLYSHSLVDHDADKRVISLHPVVQRWAIDRITVKEQQRWLDAAISILSYCISAHLEASGRTFRRSLLPHIEACLKNLTMLHGSVRADSQQRASELEKFALVFAENGLWKRSRIYQQDIVAFRRRSLGRLHLSTIRAQRSFAESNWNLFDIEPVLRTQASLRWTLFFSRPSLSDWLCWPPWLPEHVQYCMNLSDLTLSLWLAGRRDLSLWTGRRAVNGLTARLGPDDPLTLTAQFNLARTLLHLGQHAESRALLVKVLRARKRLFGHEHPDTLMVRNELGISFSFGAQTNLAVAERMLDNTMVVRKRVLGTEHAYTLWSMNDLAKVYSSRGRHNAAISLLEEVLGVAKRTLGDAHVGVFMTDTNLARAFVMAERWAEAETVIQRMLARVPTDHPEYFRLVSGYVYVLIATERFEEAQTECLAALATVEKRESLAKAGARVVMLAEQLVLAYEKQGKHDEIKALRLRIPAIGAVTIAERRFSIWDT